jgi:hypothetical protein
MNCCYYLFVFGATVLNPFTAAAPIPLCGLTGGLPCKVNHSNQRASGAQMSLADYVVSPPAAEVIGPGEQRGAPALTPRPSSFLHSGRIYETPALLPTARNR